MEASADVSRTIGTPPKNVMFCKRRATSGNFGISCKTFLLSKQQVITAATVWGTGGREFKSPRSDQYFNNLACSHRRCFARTRQMFCNPPARSFYVRLPQGISNVRTATVTVRLPRGPLPDSPAARRGDLPRVNARPVTDGYPSRCLISSQLLRLPAPDRGAAVPAPSCPASSVPPV
jgi:hypothetical protein